ncbi:hypothetical protein Acsp04_29800 [Actinomadura sp. NBRC 104425]|uniref:hypothetical protein n=1 Tax=Actinomadura sp. NBRC 104425 TaxID=3032204 RepID=UPI0024A2EDFF|nr:hypothetical protein [Actinomadura sp. NBRC 104425]GLZ12745.1 hypothetical protein Acsp04_29800 [Actinomadura sp. NBRC 104425]
MRRSSSTVVVVAGEEAGRVVAGLGGLSNVRAVTRGDRDPEEFADLVRRGETTYVVHDADPLAEVGDAWVEFFDGVSATGRLEVAIEEALGALRAGRAELPDYYVVLDPEDMPATRRHWWLGVLAGAAPSRVVPAPASAARVADALGHLAAGRWWPEDVAAWLRGLPRVVPDRAGLPGGTA